MPTNMFVISGIVSEGKTKKVLGISGDYEKVILESKDDITAGDGAKHDVIPQKGILANRTTCNVFSLLKKCNIPVAFDKQLNEKSFLAQRCKMIPLEVVVRREAHGSYLKRNPYFLKGMVFPKLIVEFFLKTSNRKWNNVDIPCDDPMIVIKEYGSDLFEASKPILNQEPFLTVSLSDIFGDENRMGELVSSMSYVARMSFLVLEKSWQLLGRRLVDYKVEFGLTKENSLLLADVIDNDSWRVLEDGMYIDKQIYREGAALSEVAEKYKMVAGLTDRFGIPNQKVIIWRGSEKDDASPVKEELNSLIGGGNHWWEIVRSWHKEPATAYMDLQKIIQDVPDSVVIAFIGRSNGAGPAISANCTVPVITVPSGWEKFPDDVWSSLRLPSNVPAMTVLDPKNAALAAVRILAARNPYLYAKLRIEQENRFVNIFSV